MCGRFNLRTPAAQLAAFFDIVFDPPLQATLAPRFNIAPSQPVLVVRTESDQVSASLVNWGLVPEWARDPAAGNRMINLDQGLICDDLWVGQDLAACQHGCTRDVFGLKSFQPVFGCIG